MLFIGKIKVMSAIREFDSKDRYGQPAKSQVVELVVTSGEETIVVSAFDSMCQAVVDNQLKEGSNVAMEVRFSASEVTAKESGNKFWRCNLRVASLTPLPLPEEAKPF